jgi:hypothetical protein
VETPPEALPPLYAGWIETLLGRPVVGEPQATCRACALAPLDDGSVPPMASPPFDARVKCCTYTPALPSFLVGAVLADGSPEAAAGRATVEARLARGEGVTPFGLDHPPGFLARHKALGVGMGRDVNHRCPHLLEDATCGIWRHREGVCATWFCRHERGGLGHQAWGALKSLFAQVESKLALWCALELGVDLPALLPLIEPRVDPPAASLRAARWGSWLGRERDYYVACAERVADLAWPDVARIGGLEVEVRARAVQAAFAALDADAPPERLRVGVHQVIAVGEDSSLVVTYSPYAPIALPSALLSVLHAFDGRPTAEVLAGLADERGVALDPDFLRQLMDWQVLVPVD